MTKLLNIEEPGQTSLPHEKQETAIGIDLGTTNSLVAIVKDGQTKIIPDKNGNLIHPSIITFTKNGKIICGIPSQKADQQTVYSIKRLMGKNFDDIKDNAQTPFKVSNHTDQPLRLKFFDKELTPAEISAQILKYLKSLAEKNLKQEVSKAVITVPAYFDENARNDTKNAALIAGLNVLRLINEPTAAAVAYGLEKKVEGIFAIFDLGGGTFDISILKLQKGIFKVIGVSGDANLGGDDFDNLIMEKITKKHNLQNLSITQIQQLKIIAKNIKEQLTDQKKATINFQLQKKSYKFTISLIEFNNLITEKIEKIINITNNLIDDLELVNKNIKGIVLVGGSTRLSLVREKLGVIFGKNKILTDIDPDKVVAIGAAIQAHALTAGSSNLLLDVTPLSLGIETMGGIVEKIIERNSTVPVSYSQEFTTYADGQTGIKLHIVQGERETASNCRSLAHFEVKDIPPLKAGIARIKITFTIDADGILTVSSEEKISGKIQRIEVKPSYGLNQNQIKEIILESAKNAQADIKQRLLIESKVESQRNILAIKAALKEDGELLNIQEIKNIKSQMKQLEKQVKLNNYEQIQEEAQKLENLAKDFAEKKMNKYINQALHGQKIDEIDKIK